MRAAAATFRRRGHAAGGGPELGASHFGGFEEWAASASPVHRGVAAAATPEGRLAEVKKRFSKFFAPADAPAAGGGDGDDHRGPETAPRLVAASAVGAHGLLHGQAYRQVVLEEGVS